MKKKLKLRKWVKVSLVGLVLGILCGVAITLVNNRMNNMYETCDNATGHMCSYYEAKNFNK